MFCIVFARRMYGTSERRPIDPQRVDDVFFVEAPRSSAPNWILGHMKVASEWWEWYLKNEKLRKSRGTPRARMCAPARAFQRVDF